MYFCNILFCPVVSVFCFANQECALSPVGSYSGGSLVGNRVSVGWWGGAIYAQKALNWALRVDGVCRD
jgi:hypothetical protein